MLGDAVWLQPQASVLSVIVKNVSQFLPQFTVINAGLFAVQFA
jgi:hypothetical protein